MSDMEKARRIEIAWDAGMRHEWVPDGTGKWTLTLIDPNGIGTQVITGYGVEDVCRVVTTAVENPARLPRGPV